MRPIDADALKAWVEEQEETKWGLSTDEVWDAIDDMPTIEPKKGKWMNKQMHDETLEPMNAWKHKCSVCGFYVVSSKKKSGWQFCPNCGAEMEMNEGEWMVSTADIS